MFQFMIVSLCVCVIFLFVEIMPVYVFRYSSLLLFVRFCVSLFDFFAVDFHFRSKCHCEHYNTSALQSDFRTALV